MNGREMMVLLARFNLVLNWSQELRERMATSAGAGRWRAGRRARPPSTH